jgi:hypothetical protein
MTATTVPAGPGFPARLDALHRQADPDGRLVASPGGHVVASVDALPDAPWQPLDRLGLAVAASRTASSPEVLATFADGLLGVQRELVRHTLGHAMRHLDARTSDGTTLLAKQQVQATLADVAMELWECAAAPRADRRTRWAVHQRLTTAARDLLRLLGASGFLTDSPGLDLHLVEVVGNVYLHPEWEAEDD